jgi:hypothetical protein
MNESPPIEEDNYILEGIKSGIIKLCPYCSILGVLETGCNYIKCPKCNGEWCWLCSLKKGEGNDRCNDKTHNSH